MRSPARKGKPDANQSAIIEAYEILGCSVVDLHAVGFGTPDLLVSFGHCIDQLVEVKVKSGRLLGSQKQFFEAHRGRRPIVVRTIDDVVRHVQTMRQEARRTLEGGDHGKPVSTEGQI